MSDRKKRDYALDTRDIKVVQRGGFFDPITISITSGAFGALKGLVPAEEISVLRENLLKYCERDTVAMVNLVAKLRLSENP
jgi:hypothetical protein